MMTLQQIRDQSPCTDGWTKLLKSLGNPPMDTVISLGDVAKSNGANDAWWCVRALDWDNEQVRRDVIKVLMLSVRRASKHTDDQRVHKCISTIQDWSDGKPADLNAAGEPAWAAAEAAWAAAVKAAAAGEAARAAEAAWEAARAAAEAAEAAEAAWAAAAWAAAAWEAARAAAEAAEAEKESQRTDLISAFPPLILK